VIVSIESNFVLELALGQSESTAARTILELAEAGTIQLIIPSFALSEPFTTVVQYRVQRNTVIDLLQKQIIQLERSARHSTLVASILLARTLLAQVAKDDLDSLEQTMMRLLPTTTSIALDTEVFKQARYYEGLYALKLQDAIIYATIVTHLAQQPPDQTKCFTSRDARAFLDPGIKTELGSYNCRVITSFDQALRYIQSAVDAAN